MSGKPVILYSNVVAGSSATISAISDCTVAAGFPVGNAFSPFTYPADWFTIERGNGPSAGDFTIEADVTAAFSSIAMLMNGVNDVIGENIRIRIYHDPANVGSFTLISTINPGTTRKTILLQSFGARAGTGKIQIRVDQINPADSDNDLISFPVIMLGAPMEFEKCIRNRYAPLDYNRKTEFLTNESGTGQYIGRSIIRRNHESSVSFDLMTAPWVRSTFQPFVRHARTKPYFFAWNPATYPNEVNYVWTDEDIGVEYTGDRNRMSASWSMRGLGNDQE
jgi:hypothetical protein